MIAISGQHKNDINFMSSAEIKTVGFSLVNISIFKIYTYSLKLSEVIGMKMATKFFKMPTFQAFVNLNGNLKLPRSWCL